MNNTCICCGEIIPEGRQVCPACDKTHIEVMARDICPVPVDCDECHLYDNGCHAKKYAKRAYAKGYLKQSRGEWKQAYNSFPRYVCTNCNHLFNNKTFKYCPNCGAKMKGGAE